MSEPTKKIIVENLFKVFGANPKKALELYRNGYDKNTVLEQTGQTIGVCDANFCVYSGEIFVVMGLSGSGKSTLVRLLNKLIEPSSGKILVDGTDIAAMGPREILNLRRQCMTMVFQSFALMPHLSVLDNAAFGLEVAGVAKAERHARALAALEQVGLETWADSYPNELSGGMQQRVGLARALANDPEIMLMDEAFSALDPLIRTEMQDQLLDLQENNQRTIVFISHDLDEAMRIGDRIAIMEGGRVVQVGTPEEILKAPADDYVRAFFRGVDISQVLTAADVARREQVTLIEREGTGVRTAMARMSSYDRPFGYVVDRSHHYHGVVSEDSLEEQLQSDDPTLNGAFLEGVEPIAANTVIGDLLGPVAHSPCALPVVDAESRYVGVVSRTVLLQTLDRGA